ncbi:uncharacterized protein PAC_09408 [Phialocephala subalpina]|uniref:Uncharacterized protein n=1 Tax=Phialocephala subalpina TaxID=576137 RepID=A0A1L7X3E3_9HELO|nr:uncharacterized protein PAC_09408 [Phialocephala subalpina]
MRLQELVAIMTSSNQAPSSSPSQHAKLVLRSKGSLPSLSDIKALTRARSPLLKLAEEILRLIFDQVFLRYGICAATCMGLANKQLYPIFKPYNLNPVNLTAPEYNIVSECHF